MHKTAFSIVKYEIIFFVFFLSPSPAKMFTSLTNFIHGVVDEIKSFLKANTNVEIACNSRFFFRAFANAIPSALRNNVGYFLTKWQKEQNTIKQNANSWLKLNFPRLPPFSPNLPTSRESFRISRSFSAGKNPVWIVNQKMFVALQ